MKINKIIYLNRLLELVILILTLGCSSPKSETSLYYKFEKDPVVMCEANFKRIQVDKLWNYWNDSIRAFYNIESKCSVYEDIAEDSYGFCYCKNEGAKTCVYTMVKSGYPSERYTRYEKYGIMCFDNDTSMFIQSREEVFQPHSVKSFLSFCKKKIGDEDTPKLFSLFYETPLMVFIPKSTESLKTFGFSTDTTGSKLKKGRFEVWVTKGFNQYSTKDESEYPLPEPYRIALILLDHDNDSLSINSIKHNTLVDSRAYLDSLMNNIGEVKTVYIDNL